MKRKGFWSAPLLAAVLGLTAYACGQGSDRSCDDSIDCTFDWLEAEACHHEARDARCPQGQICSLQDGCQALLPCTSAAECDDANPCTEDGCDPAVGCQHEDNADPCDDGNPCTAGDACSGGACQGGSNQCGCTGDADCAAHEDGNLCNGTLRCADGGCAIDPTTIVTCDPSDDTACRRKACDPGTGACGMQDVHEGQGCDDGDACTTADTCAAGVCGGTALGCDDINPCTLDGCDPASGCVHDPNANPCEDGDACTLNDACAQGACQAGEQASCDDGNPCTSDGCDPASGCVHDDDPARCVDEAATACAEGSRARCEQNPSGCLVWSAPVPCPTGECADTVSCVACVDECTALETRCAGGSLETCEPQADGCFHWGAAVACPSGSCADAMGCAALALSDLPPYDVLGTEWDYYYRYSGYGYTQYAEAYEAYTPEQGDHGVVHLLTMNLPVTMYIYYTFDGEWMLYDRVVSNGLVTSYDPPLQILKAPLAIGESWSQTVYVSSSVSGEATHTIEVLGLETVTVDAGTYDCVRLHVVHDGPPSSYECDEWWSQEVGLVKSNLYDDYELLRYAAP